MVLTRSQYNKLIEMADSSDHIAPPRDDDEEISREELVAHMQDSKFQRLVEKVLLEDPTKYFHHIASLGIKLPADFDISSIRENADNERERDTNDTVPQANEKGKQPIDQNAPMADVRQQIESLKLEISNLKIGTSSKNYSLEDIAPYPFDRSLVMKPFPFQFGIPKFDKYKGKGDPRDHIQEFTAACLEVAHNKTYLMRLFPRSLGGQAMEWFSRLPLGIKTFDELVNKFITHFSYNIEHEVSMLDLCNTKQKGGESFATFLQRWRQLASKCSYDMPEKQLLEMFVHNLHPDLSYQIQIQCPTSFTKVIEMGLFIEKAMIAKGTLKLYKDTPPSNYTTDKSKFWTKNKNVVNDGVVDAKAAAPKQQPIFTLKEEANNGALNKPPPRESRPLFNSNPRRKFTPLGESQESALRKLLANNEISLPPTSDYEPIVKPPYWKDTDYCEYHRGRGHTTNNCICLKNIIQDILDQNQGGTQQHTSNESHVAYRILS